MARVQGDDLVLEPQGRLLVHVDGADVTYFQSDGVTPLTIYDAEIGGSVVGQPLTTIYGRVEPVGGGDWWHEPGVRIRYATHPDGRTLPPLRQEAYSALDAEALSAAVSDLAARGLSVTLAGAVGDGVADDQPPIQATINTVRDAGGGIVWVPPGAYYLGSPLTFYNNVRLLGAGPGLTNFLTNDGWTDTAFTGAGTLGVAVAVSGDYGVGDTLITTAAAHGLAAGDWVRVIGQRNALSDDADDLWRLGHGTPGAGVCYYGEFLQVKQVNSATQFITYTGLTFPDYRDDDTAETDVAATRTQTTIQKVTFLEGTLIANISVEVQGPHNGVFRPRYTRDCHVKNVRVDAGSYTGVGVFWHDSLECTSEDVRVEYGPDCDFVGVGDFAFTGFKFAGSQRCEVIRGHAYNGGQGVDFTYFNNGVCTIGCVAKDCHIEASNSSGMVAHGGTYANVWRGNMLAGVPQGINCRGRSSILEGNTALCGEPLSSSDASQYGFGINEGWAQDVTMTGNTAVGFFAGYGIIDANDINETFRYAGLTLNGNVAKSCYHAVYHLRANVAVDRARGLSISGMVCHDIANYTVELTEFDDVAIMGGLAEEIGGGLNLGDCSVVVVTGGIYRASVVGAGNGAFAHTNSSGVSITGAQFADFDTGVTLSSTASDCTVALCKMPGCTTPTDPSTGTGHVFRDNTQKTTRNIASAAGIVIPPDLESYARVTGTETITSITAGPPNWIIVLRCASDGAWTLTDGGNIRLASTFTAGPFDTITLVCDGTDWYEIARSAN